jgi:hypothetical protein
MVRPVYVKLKIVGGDNISQKDGHECGAIHGHMAATVNDRHLKEKRGLQPD